MLNQKKSQLKNQNTQKSVSSWSIIANTASLSVAVVMLTLYSMYHWIIGSIPCLLQHCLYWNQVGENMPTGTTITGIALVVLVLVLSVKQFLLYRKLSNFMKSVDTLQFENSRVSGELDQSMTQQGTQARSNQ